MTSTGSARASRRSAPGSHVAASGAAAGTHTLAAPVAYSWRLSSSVYAGSASANTAAVNRFWSGPPSAMRASGRLESTVRSPYRGLSALLQVAVTPARTSATIRSRASGADSASVGDTTSATDTARTLSPTRTRTADDNPNQP